MLNDINSLSKKTIKSLLNEPSQVEKHIRQTWLGDCLQVGLGYFITHGDDIIDTQILEKYQQGLTELEQGKPLAYVMEHQAFWKHDFIVNEHTLIPRPDTEILVETVLNLAKNSLSKNKTNLNILDLGTGTGCIAISLASELLNAKVTAVDFSTEALKVAQLNQQRVGVNNLSLQQSDWFSALANKKFDIIVSNPPYIDPTDPHLPALTHEPITALTAENRGLADIEKIVANAPNFLTNHGLLAIEHGYDQAEKVKEIFAKNGFEKVETVKDFGGNDRVTYGFHNLI